MSGPADRDLPPTRPAESGGPPETELGLTQESIVRSLVDRGDATAVQLDPVEGEVPPPELQLGSHKYRILGELGSGGMGRVYLAFDQDLGRNVALKMLRAPGDEGSQRFLDEARVMAQLDHPNIVPVHEVGRAEGGRLYYTMRVVQGRTFGALLEDRAGHSLARLAQLFLQIGQGVAFAHAKGVVHGDLKPSNVMIGAHGEVFVLDWGLSRLVSASLSVPGHEGIRKGQVAGTPLYMAPEQARGEDVDARTDVYALGAILYEMLTLRPPFTGDVEQVLFAVRSTEPPGPRHVAPGREIPRALEEACLRALAKDRSARQPSVHSLMSEVRDWLESEADRERRREVAQDIARNGRDHLEEYLTRKKALVELEREAKDVARRFEGWEPVEQKEPLIEAEDRVTAARRELSELASTVVGTLERALAFESENATAREAMADYYWNRFQEAERSGREEDQAFFARRVLEYHDGKYDRELGGEGTLTLDSDPPGADVTLHRIEPAGFVVEPGEGRPLGTTPLEGVPLSMGSHLLTVRRQGFREVRYPVLIGRNERWEGTVRLFDERSLGEGFLHVPAGPFVCGGDDGARRSLPRDRPFVEDLFLAEHPVTMEEYLEFLNDLARREGVETAVARSPRRSARDPVTSYLRVDGSGTLHLREVDSEGDRWDPRLPVVGVTWNDAVAYCEWRSAREGRRFRLPTEIEWEKASRGVDGRWFPWGWRFDPTLCNMEESRRERPAPVPIDEFPTDRSVYGIRGTAGNVQEWTATERVEGEGSSARTGRVVRGGAWQSVRSHVRCAARYDYAAETTSDIIGFRIAVDLD